MPKEFLRAVVLVCILLATVNTGFSQYQIQTWTTDEGLPQNTVSSILQTPDGYLWMTTLDGLVRFDGVRFTIFNKHNTVDFATNRLGQLVQSPNGDLWFGTESDFVMRYHAGRFMIYALSAGKSPNNSIGNLILDNNGSPVAFSNAGIFRWNGENFVPFTALAGENHKSSVWWSKSGAFWYSNENILHRLKDGKISDFQLPGDKNTTYIVKLFEDSRGRLWMGTRAGLFVVENENLKTYTMADGLPSNDAKPSAEDRDGNIWIVTIGGVAIITPDGKISTVTTAQGLSENYSTTVFQDREGGIWVGTFHRGLNHLTKQTIQFYSVKDGLAAAVVHPVYQLSNTDIVLGGGSLTRHHDHQFSHFSEKEKSIPNAATAIAQDRTGRIWFGHWSGAYYYENGKFKDFTERLGQKTSIVDIHEDESGVLWFASNVGLFRYQNDVVTLLTNAQNLVSNDVKVIHESPDGTLWFGTYGGLSKFRDGVFTSYTTAEGLSSNQVRSLYEDSEGTLWIGSYDGGLTRLRAGKFTPYTSYDGLFNDGVFQIIEDGRGNLWMSCNRGIYRVAKQQLNDFADGKITRLNSTVYGKADGLLETECNGGQQPAGIKAHDGKLWFPTQGGVAVIDPENIPTNPFAPPVVIESAEVDNNTVSISESIKIEPGKNNLEINYTGLSFIKSELLSFRYKLEGLDDEWIEVGTRRTAYYSYLPPGDYNFRVIAANSDGVWNTQGASVKVIVKPPYYRTWWFLILSLTMILVAAYLLYRWRINRLKRDRQLQEKFSHELLTSQETERQRVAAELHDGLGQSLLVIKNRALLGKMASHDKIESHEQFEEISRASSQALEEVREIAYNLRPYHLDRLGLTQSLKAMLDSINDSTTIDFGYDIMPLEGVFPKNEEVMVYRIIQECINNIIKHSEASQASILIHQSRNGLTMTIEDNGRGFTPMLPQRTKGGFGLIGLEERVRILGGTLLIRSETDNGTTIIIRELAKNRQRII